MIIHFMPELKLLKEYNSFSHELLRFDSDAKCEEDFGKCQKGALSESSQSNI